jgi:hypothetical protein
MVERPMDTQYYSPSDVFVTQTVGTNRALNMNSDSTDYDPMAPPAGATATGAFPKTTFFLVVDGMGSLEGTVSVAGAPLAGATVSVAGTALSYTTGADGTYSFPYIAEGAQEVTATKHGYSSVTHTVTIVEDQTSTQDFALALLPQVAVSGRIVGSDNPTVGIADATISLAGYEPYEATTDASGQFSIPNVFSGHTYTYSANAIGYAAATGTVEVGTTPVNMGDVIVNEVAYPPHGLVATESTDYTQVALEWQAPVPGGNGEWIHYDNGENNDSIGLTDGGEFVAAIRFPASELTDYAGMSLHAISLFPGDAGTYSLRVYTGGTPTAPGTQVVDQPFTVTTIDEFQTVVLDNPVLITGTEELWFGFNVSHAAGAYPAGCDAGPALNGFGNMIYNSGAWSTLYDLASSLNYNWNISGYVGYSGPTRGELVSLSKPGRRVPVLHDVASISNMGTFRTASGNSSTNRSASNFTGHRVSTAAGMDRSLSGYKVYRLLAADQQNEANWTDLTNNVYGQTTYADNAWGPLPSGVYKFAVKAVYTNNVMSPAAFSAELHKGMMGTLTGTVTEFGTELPVEGATVTAGEYSGITNAQGVYSFAAYAGTYSVTASKTGYQAATQDNIVVTGLQTTTANFILTEITLPPAAVQAEQAGNNVNITWLAPGSGAELTEGFEGTAFPPADWSQVINNTGAAVLEVLPTWCQAGTVALTPPIPPHGGESQAGMWWSYDYQDEWLKTPAFNCLPGASLSFWSYVYFGSTNGDHYYVKVSTDGGNSWTVLWDASTQTGGQNAYTTPITIDLSSYGGQEIMLAFHAEDPPSDDGMWYVWFIDDIHIGTPTRTISFSNDQLSRARFDETRAMEGYKVWRLLQGQESNEAQWAPLTPQAITATAHQDTDWGTLPDGNYKWAVKAVYTGGALSNSAFSNVVPRITEIGTIAGFVRDTQNQAISGATVSSGDYTATTNNNGAYSLTIPAGNHTVTASHPNYSAVTQTGIVVVTGQTTTVNFNLPESQIVLEEDFESYADFSLTFAPWTLLDVDGSATYGFNGISFLNSGSAMAYIIFNPDSTTPPLEDTPAHSGNKFAASFAAMTAPNNDWLITPQFGGGGEIAFWAKSFTADYGLERFKVGVSTTGTAAGDFEIISAGNFIEAPVDWTEYTYDLSAYAGLDIYVGIQCVSDDAFIFFVDDVTITGSVSNEDGVAPVYANELKGNYPNPFNPETNIRFSLKEAAKVSIEIYNVKGQLVRKLVNDVRDAGDHAVVWNGVDNNGRAVSSGVYYYKMSTGKYSSTKKMILMK